jgi:hypothetical protein
MKGLIHRAATVVALAAALGGTGCWTTCGGDAATCAGGGGAGCGKNGRCDGNGCNDWDLYDRCYPQRYWYMARNNVNAAMAPQVQNGHVLDQTIWNHHFEPGTAILTQGGQDHLMYLARRRPCPDTTLYLQTGLDLPYDPACPDHLAGARQELDTRRVQSIQKFLVAHTAGRPTDFHVLIHDPNDPSQAATPVAQSIGLMYLRYRGGTSNLAGGSGGGSGGGATGGAGAVGGGGAIGGR